MRSIDRTQGIHQEVGVGAVRNEKHVGDARSVGETAQVVGSHSVGEVAHAGQVIGVSASSAHVPPGRAMSFHEALSSTLQENAELYHRLAQ